MPDELFTLRVLSPLGTVFEGQVRQATLPTPDGEITVLAHHMPVVAVLSEGEMRIPSEKGEVVIALAGGFLDTGANTATVLSDFAAEAESIEVARVEAARKRAEEALAEKKLKGEIALVERDLQRSLLQLKVAERYRRRRTRQ
ncbi:MAG TPA: ATP synthase F1 subunit epsilon [Spirochaetia bacterium]|nr:ATP synthase F1 subunit epsilon [Spirochaetia bacterium]